MKILKYKVELTNADAYMLGLGLELYLEAEMKLYKTYKTFEELNEDELCLLNVFLDTGYELSISADEFLKYKEYTDVWEWAKVKYKKVHKTDIQKMDEVIKDGNALIKKYKTVKKK